MPEPLRAVWEAVLGASDFNALDDLYARVIWIPDGELERLDDAAGAYREIVGEPDPPPSAAGAGERPEARRRRGEATAAKAGASADRAAGNRVARRRDRAGDR